MMKQYMDAFLIVRLSGNGRRVVGTTFSEAVAERSCVALQGAYYNLGMGNQYVVEMNPKYKFAVSVGQNRVVGAR